MSPKKILLLTTTIRNMPNRNQFQKPWMLARHFSVQGFFKFPPDVDIPFLSDFKDYSSFHAGNYLENRNRALVSGAGKWLRIPVALINSMRYFKTALGRMRQFRAAGGDCVYTAWDTSGMLCGLIAKSLGLKWVADIWDDPEKEIINLPDGLGRSLKLAVNRRLTKRFLGRADVIISLLPDVLRDRYRIPAEKTIIHTNGVDLKRLNAVRQSHRPLQRDQTLRIIYTGPLEYNRLFHLPAIVERMNRLEMPWEMSLVGPHFSQQDLDWLKKQCMPVGAGRVKIITEKPFEDTVQMIIESDICICPYPTNRADLANAYPIKIFEYMALKKPVVMFKLPKMTEILVDRQEAILIENEDLDGFVNAIQELAANPDTKEQLGKNARRKAETFDWHLITNQIAQQLLKML